MWLIIVGIGAILRTQLFFEPRPFLEIGVHAAFFWFLLTRPKIVAFVQPIPKPHKALLLVFFTLFYAGQFTQDLRLTYPFTAWAMYARPESRPEITFYRYRGYTREGSVVELSPERIVPAGDKHVVTTKLKNLIAAAYPPATARNRDRPVARADLTSFLAAIGAIYNRDHPDQPIEAIEVYAYDWRFREQDHSEPKPRSVIRVDVEHGR
jgi:hypothetical protein